MELPEHPTNEMIRAGVVILGELACTQDLSSRDISDLVEAIWLEMARACPKGARWVEAEPPVSTDAHTEPDKIEDYLVHVTGLAVDGERVDRGFVTSEAAMEFSKNLPVSSTALLRPVSLEAMRAALANKRG